jgi:hypothetical protein
MRLDFEHTPEQKGRRAWRKTITQRFLGVLSTELSTRAQNSLASDGMWIRQRALEKVAAQLIESYEEWDSESLWVVELDDDDERAEVAEAKLLQLFRWWDEAHHIFTGSDNSRGHDRPVYTHSRQRFLHDLHGIHWGCTRRCKRWGRNCAGQERGRAVNFTQIGG